jgi:fermentation-respiration switch protein FrsA (DUF1100 family)
MKWRKLTRFAGLAAVAGLGFFGMLKIFEHSQVYHPDRVLIDSPARWRHPFEEVHFPAPDGVKLHGWYFPGSNAPAGPVILFCHGNGGNISHRLDAASALLGTGASVFLFDYRGYGRSTGRPSEQGTYRDAHAAYDWLLNRGHAAAQVMAFGESLGGGVASELAATRTVGGLVLQSTFTSIIDVGAELFPWLPVKWLGSIQYNTLGRLPVIRAPVLVMHSRKDGLVGYRHAEKNFAAANEPKRLVDLRGGHNESLLDRQAYINGVIWLLEAAAVRP